MNSIILILFFLAIFTFGKKIITSEDSKFPNTNGIGISTAPGLLKKCGDGKLFFVSQECDDGNSNNGDGCSNCKVDKGWNCTKINGQKSVCQNLCGNGKLDEGQQCEYTLPGRICTLNCIRDYSKVNTCSSLQLSNVDPGQVCDYLFGCYNCLYIDPNYICQNTLNQDTQLITTLCRLKCSVGASKQSVTSFQLYNLVTPGLILGSFNKLIQLGLRVSDMDQTRPYQENTFWNAYNINFTQIHQNYPQYIFVQYIAIMDIIRRYMQVDQNGIKTVTLFYQSKLNDLFSWQIKYGAEYYNKYQNCIFMKPVPS